MKKQKVLTFLCVLLISLQLVLISFSAPKQVRADEAPPVSQEQDGEWTDEAMLGTPGQVFDLKLENGPKANFSHMSYGGTSIDFFGTGGLANPVSSCVFSNAERRGIQGINIPHGSLIWGFDITGFDYKAQSKVTVYLEENYYDGHTQATILGRLGTTESFSDGEFTKAVVFAEPHYADNYNNNYVFRVELGASDENVVALCHVTLFYTPPSPFPLALPLINK